MNFRKKVQANRFVVGMPKFPIANYRDRKMLDTSIAACTQFLLLYCAADTWCTEACREYSYGVGKFWFGQYSECEFQTGSHTSASLTVSSSNSSGTAPFRLRWPNFFFIPVSVFQQFISRVSSTVVKRACAALVKPARVASNASSAKGRSLATEFAFEAAIAVSQSSRIWKNTCLTDTAASRLCPPQ